MKRPIIQSLPVHVKVGGNPYNLTGIDRSGTVCWRLMVPFLRNVVSSSRFVAYSDHQAVLGRWSPAHGGSSTLAFLRNNWKIYVRDVNTARLLWSQSIVDAGEAIAISGDTELWTIHLVNTKGYFLLGKTAKYTIELREVTTGQLRHAWHLPILRWTPDKWSIANQAKETSEIGRMTPRFLDGRWQLSFATIKDSRNVVEMSFTGREQTPSMNVRYTRTSKQVEVEIGGHRLTLHR